jgi:hypothetical protein
MKPEEIIINTGRDLATIISYSNLEIFISIITKGARIDIIIISKFRYTVLVYLDIVIIIKSIKSDLPYNYNLLFKLSQLNILIITAYIVNYNINKIIVRNNTDLLIIISRYTRLGKIIKYKVIKYF